VIKFSLADFHDRLLAGGLVPIKVIRREMMGKTARFFDGFHRRCNAFRSWSLCQSPTRDETREAHRAAIPNRAYLKICVDEA
jgi:hypothetical protein